MRVVVCVYGRAEQLSWIRSEMRATANAEVVGSKPRQYSTTHNKSAEEPGGGVRNKIQSRSSILRRHGGQISGGSSRISYRSLRKWPGSPTGVKTNIAAEVFIGGNRHLP